MPSVPTITFDVRASRLLMLAVAGMALVALAAVIAARLVWPAQLVLCLLIVVYAALSVRKLRHQPLRAVGWHADDSWTLHLADGREATGKLLSGRVLGPLIVLRLGWSDGGHCALALAPDNIDADARRHLRMRLSALPDNE